MKQPGLHKINEIDKPLGSLGKKTKTIELKYQERSGEGGCITKTLSEGGETHQFLKVLEHPQN